MDQVKLKSRLYFEIRSNTDKHVKTLEKPSGFANTLLKCWITFMKRRQRYNIDIDTKRCLIVMRSKRGTSCINSLIDGVAFLINKSVLLISIAFPILC